MKNIIIYPFAIPLAIFGGYAVKRRFIRKFVLNNAYAKLLIITGALKWWDIPHLHHPLILLKSCLEYRLTIKEKRRRNRFE